MEYELELWAPEPNGFWGRLFEREWLRLAIFSLGCLAFGFAIAAGSM